METSPWITGLHTFFTYRDLTYATHGCEAVDRGIQVVEQCAVRQ